MAKGKKIEILDIKNIWLKVKPALAENIGDMDTFNRWIEPIVPLEANSEEIKLGVADDFTADWIGTHFDSIICNELSKYIPYKIKLTYETGHSVQITTQEEQSSYKKITSKESQEKTKSKQDVSNFDKEVSSDFTFASFVVGPENRFAFAAAYGAATGEGMIPNPLFIYGGTSSGKTHLMKAICNEVKTNKKNKVFEYVPCEDFLNIYVDCLRRNKHYEFRNRFRNVDYLLIDDIQFIANTPRLQEEFFNTFNSLYRENKIIVLTSDKIPAEINGLEPRLVSRFESGLTLEIEPYGEETRLAILRKKQEKHKIKIDDEILRFLARNISSHVRKLEGALNRLIAAVIYTNTKLTLETAEKLLKPYLEEAANHRISIERIQRTVAEHYDLRVSDLTGKKRPNNIALPRMIAMYLCRQLTDHSLPDIGDAFGRNHATVIHAVSKIEKDCQSDNSLSAVISQLKRRIQSVN
ncbi:MAG TPA: chromosomal replication initiator protein DnaA [Victivallales bacterium]|nr:chromosomal replication initiator protein DnaA [Victivallales bacterium]HRR29269.1 chromosomal replication initiator protein DnaA [Victivallales bacterium]